MILKIEPENAGRRLDKFLFSYLNNAPHSFIYKILRKKQIKLNGAKVKGSELLQAGDELRFFLSDETIEGCRKEIAFEKAEPLTGIIFEDENILVVNKPAGLPSQGGMKKADHLLARILFYLQKNDCGICNRLDVNTSGLVVCGKNPAALKKINSSFANREVKKEYLAVVCGIAGEKNTTHTLEGFYHKNEKTNTATVIAGRNPHAVTNKPVITVYTVLAVSKKYSLISVSPITGRSHQIRAHLASVGHPLSGDKKYGGSATSFATAQLLHCLKLSIPEFGTFTAPLPKGFEECIQKNF
ncbi:MAG: RluA family pseudouridine synthase [Clostridiales bacterium]|jgi:23S rRNA pseudouridine955/2504/2580 synthase|nr:RluA family pseudouridine synthase [Clostridiales bacterium]